jgi:periplasmic copper chaperone A
MTPRSPRRRLSSRLAALLRRASPPPSAGLLIAACLLAAGLLATAAATAAGAPGAAAGARTGEPVRVQQAWIRWLPANLPAGGYVTLTNLSDRAVALISASSPDYGSVALHRSLVHNGTASMVPVARINLAAHATLNFESLGYHLMLMQPRASVAPGDHVPVTLHFADGGSLTASFEVRKPAAGAPDAKSMANMPGMSH